MGQQQPYNAKVQKSPFYPQQPDAQLSGYQGQPSHMHSFSIDSKMESNPLVLNSSTLRQNSVLPQNISQIPLPGQPQNMPG
jgi:hypothetical protein